MIGRVVGLADRRRFYTFVLGIRLAPYLDLLLLLFPGTVPLNSSSARNSSSETDGKRAAQGQRLPESSAVAQTRESREPETQDEERGGAILMSRCVGPHPQGLRGVGP